MESGWVPLFLLAVTFPVWPMLYPSMGVSPFGAQIMFAFKVFTIGAVLVVSLAASFFVQEVVNDRIKFALQLLHFENKNGQCNDSNTVDHYLFLFACGAAP